MFIRITSVHPRIVSRKAQDCLRHNLLIILTVEIFAGVGSACLDVTALLLVIT